MDVIQSMGFNFVGEEYFLDSCKVDEHFVSGFHVKLKQFVSSRRHFNFSRSCPSHWDMSERMIKSPTCKPSTISMLLTELRPSFTGVRTAAFPPSITLKRLTRDSAWPLTGRPT